MKLLQALLFVLAFPGVGFANEAELPDVLAKTIKPGIVAVGTYSPGRVPKEVLLGTGFIVGDGQTAVTNAHVVNMTLDTTHLEEFALFYRQGTSTRMFFAKVSTIDESHDLALLSIADAPLPALEIGDSQKVREGEMYAFTGYPIGQILGLYPVTHHGMISAISPIAIPVKQSYQLNSAILKKLQAPYDVFQLDATAFPGNSGSPLYDPKTGKVIGILNKVFVQDSKENVLSNPSGISYAIPAEYIKMFLAEKNIKN